MSFNKLPIDLVSYDVLKFLNVKDVLNVHINNYNDFSKEQLDEIIKGSIDNRQIHESSGSSITFLKEIVEKYNVIIDKKEIDKLKSLLPSLRKI